MNDNNPDVCVQIISTLTELKAKAAILPLIEKLQDKNAEVQKFAANALGKLEAKTAVEPLIKVLQDQNFEVRNMSIIALGHLKEKKAISPLFDIYKKGVNLDTCKKIAWAIGEINSAKTIIPLIAMLDDNHLYIYNYVIEILRRFWADKAIPIFIDKLKIGDAEVFIHSAFILEELRAKDAIEPLIKHIEDENIEICKAVVSALGKIGSGNKKVINLLITLLKQNNSEIHDDLMLALGELKAKEAIPILIDKLKDNNSEICRTAMLALSMIKAKEAIPFLIEKLFDDDFFVRFDAISTLTKLKAKEAIPILIKELEDKNIHICMEAIQALGELKSKEAIKPLIKKFEIHYPEVREKVVVALGNINSKDVIISLIKAVDDKDEKVKRTAITAIKYKGIESVDFILNRLKSNIGNIRDIFLILADIFEQTKNNTIYSKLVKLPNILDYYKFLEGYSSGAYFFGRRLPPPELLKIIEEQKKRIEGKPQELLDNIGNIVNDATDKTIKAVNNGTEKVIDHIKKPIFIPGLGFKAFGVDIEGDSLDNGMITVTDATMGETYYNDFNKNQFLFICILALRSQKEFKNEAINERWVKETRFSKIIKKWPVLIKKREEDKSDPSNNERYPSGLRREIYGILKEKGQEKLLESKKWKGYRLSTHPGNIVISEIMDVLLNSGLINFDAIKSGD